MAGYRPLQQGYGPPSDPDPYARPGSTTYGRPQPGSQGYGPPPSQQHHSQYHGSNPLPPPPPGGPPPNSAGYNNSAAYQGQLGGGAYAAPPSLPPRVSQPYGPPSATPPNVGQQAYQTPTYGPPQTTPHQRAPSVPSAYHQEVSQNAHGWPQHPQYSSQPTTHRYDPPLPPRPGSQGRPSAGDGRRYSLYEEPSSQYAPTSGPHGQTGQPQYQMSGLSQNYDSAPSSASQYSPDDPSHPNYQPQDAYQTQGGYRPPPPPPKPPQLYDTQQGRPAYPPRMDSQPPRPSSVQHSYQQQYTSPPPPASGYPTRPPEVQYAHDQASQYQQYPPPQGQHGQSQDNYQQAPPQGTGGYPGQPGYGRQTPSQAPPRPYSNPQGQLGYPRPPPSSDEPVSPLQGRQSISSERPGSVGPNAGSSDQSNPKPVAPRPSPKTNGSTFAFSSDWEHFGSGADEIDDTAMYGVKADDKDARMATVELPASMPAHERTDSEVSAPESFHPSPAIGPAVMGLYVPTPPSSHPSRQSMQPPSQQPRPPPENVAPEDADYIPPMPGTPPAAQRPARTPIVIGGSSQRQQAKSPPPAFLSGGEVNQPVAHVLQQAMQTQSLPSKQASQDTRSSGEYARGPGSQQQSYAPQMNVPTIRAEQGPSVDTAEFKKAQEEAEGLRAKLAAVESELTGARTSLANKESLLAQRDSTIVEKDALITQKDEEIAQRTTHLDEMQASLDEITETFTILRTSTSDLENQLKTSEAAQAELKSKLEKKEAESTVTRNAHESEKSDLNGKVREVEDSLAAALAEIESLKKQVEGEKSKAEAKAAEPVDIAPGLEPWFKGSLERYKEMLYTESKPIPVSEKLQVFMDTVNAEARLRGIDMPFGPKGEVKGFNVPAAPPKVQAVTRQEVSQTDQPKVSPPKESDGFVMVDPDAEMQYSPGGRPILNASAESRQSRGSQAQAPQGPIRRESSPGEPSTDGAQRPAYQPFRSDTPGSGPSTRGPSPARPVTNQSQQPASKPYARQQSNSNSQTPAAPPTPPQLAVTGPNQQTPVYKPLYKPTPSAATDAPAQANNPEIMLDHVPGMNPRGRQDTMKNGQEEAMRPLPLNLRPSGPTPCSSAPADIAKQNTSQDARPPLARNMSSTDRLNSLKQADPQRKTSKRVQELTKALDAINTDYTATKTLTRTWEDKAAVTRTNLAKERAKRQAELEKRNDELYNSGEIGYGDFETLEGQAKEEEQQIKAKEDAAEYESYAKEVFDVNFRRFQEDIAAMARLQHEVDDLLRVAGAGEKTVSKNDQDESVSQVMGLMLSIHQKAESTHAEIVKAVQERDRRYKLTQTKPLYAKGDIAGMKRIEKAFEEQEKKAEVRARVERAERCKRIWSMMDVEMERGAGENDDFAESIITAAEDAVDKLSPDELLVSVANAQTLVKALYEDTMSLMRMFEQVDVQLNECEYEVSVASARNKGDGKEFFERLEGEKKKEDVKLREDGEKRLAAVRERMKEAEGMLGEVKEMAGMGSEAREARDRKKRALEEARRRNGER